jgi:hypothetical protein
MRAASASSSAIFASVGLPKELHSLSKGGAGGWCTRCHGPVVPSACDAQLCRSRPHWEAVARGTSPGRRLRRYGRSRPPVPLTIDLTAANRRVSDEDFHDWAQGQTLFLSSVMGELAAERGTVAEALVDAGFTVRWFEDFGGRDDSADVAYLTEVAAADIYVGVLADDYGAMQASGYSATHEEFLEARRRGKRVTFWAHQNGNGRQGHARRFLDDVRVFNVTGSFGSGDDLTTKLLRRLREMAAEDLSPWVKVGDTVFRAETITDSGVELRIEALVRDAAVMTALRALQPDPQWGNSRVGDVPVTYGDRSGIGRVTAFSVQTCASATQQVSLTIEVRWVGGRDSMASGINGLSHEDVVEAGIRSSLLGEALPQQLRSFGWGAAEVPDPLTQLQGVQLAEGSVGAVARLLLVEELVGNRRVAAIEDFALGPVINGQRRLRVGWREHQVYSNQPVGHRVIEGERAW